MLQLASLKKQGDRLKKQLNRDKSGRIRSKYKCLVKRREGIRELSVKRREDLELSRLISVFNRDAALVTFYSVSGNV